jgi:hypothetical protein
MDGINGGGRNIKAVAALKDAMDAFVRSTKQAKEELKSLNKELETTNSSQLVTRPDSQSSGQGSSQTVVPRPTQTAVVVPTGTGNSVMVASPNGGGSGTNYPTNPFNSQMPDPEKFLPSPSSKVGGAIGGLLLRGLGSASMYASMLLPSTNEALRLNLLGERYRFYGGDASMAGGTGGKLSGGSYGEMGRLAKYGTALNAFDPAFATNVGAAQGLLPGLKNYGVGENYTGVMGGAALMSNLVPGSGLQGGMQGMAALNQARSVNMLRMVGINVRNNGGTGMRDLPDIINQLYKMLKQSAGVEPTPEMIAVSAMSGNALDSILSQYFGNDENLRQSVIAALVQMSRSGGTNIGVSGNKKNLIKTHATTKAVSSLATRFAGELKLNQSTSAGVLEGAVAGNDVINGINSMLSNIATNKVTGGVAQAAIGTTGFLSTMGGIGGGRMSDYILNDIMNGISGKDGVGNVLGDTKLSGVFRDFANKGIEVKGKKFGTVGGLSKILGAIGLGATAYGTFGKVGANPYETLPGQENAFGMGGGAYAGSPNADPTVTPQSDGNRTGKLITGKGSNGGTNVFVTLTVPPGMSAADATTQAVNRALSAAGVNF